jgi:hypothetical protein
MEAASNYNIKELHEKTGHYIRLAGKSPTPISITDRGKVVAVISSPDLVISRPRVRKYSKDFQEYFESALSKNSKKDSIQEDIDAIRGDL